MTSPDERRRRLMEVGLLFGATLVVTVGLTIAQGAVGWLRAYLLVIVAATFLYLPLEVLHRRGEDPEALGIHRKRPLQALKAALWLMLLTFPPYLVGFHGWQTGWLERSFAPAEARLDRWPVELQDAPRIREPAEGDVWLYADGADGLRLRWRLPAGQRLAGGVATDAPLTVLTGGHQARLDPDGRGLRLDAGSVGLLTLRGPATALTVALEAGGDRLPPDRLKLGTALTAAGGMPYRAERGLWWLLNLVLVQLLLVALPEEVFYRGYLQSRLDGLVGRDRRILGVDVNLTSLLLTSALFAVGHIATIPHPSRLAVFFPSLLFGWLRRRTGGILAPVLYHAACNLLVELAGVLYR